MANSVNPGDDAVATSTAAAATINHTGGVITTEALTTAAAAVYSFTLTNALIGVNSVVLVSAGNGTNTTQGLSVIGVTPAAGSCVILVKNVNASALNGTITLAFAVL